MTRRTLLVLALVSGCGAEIDLGGASDAGDAAISLEEAGVLECPGLASPDVVSTCHACDHDAGDCQPNGCFNGFYCKISSHDCTDAPKTCDDAGAHD